MKPGVRLFAAALGFLCLIGGAYGAPGKRFKSAPNGFAITFPAGWQIKKGFMGTVVLALSPAAKKSGRENVNVGVEEVTPKTTLEAYGKGSVASMKNSFTDFKLLDQGTARISKQKAMWLVYSFRMGKLKLENLDYLFVYHKHGYVITCSSTPGEFRKSRPTFEKIVATFALR